jgi:hypothetical protein
MSSVAMFIAGPGKEIRYFVIVRLSMCEFGIPRRYRVVESKSIHTTRSPSPQALRPPCPPSVKILPTQA